MTLSDFATFSTAISGLAVTASLIYLALQTYQSGKHMKALVHRGRTSRIPEVLRRNALGGQPSGANATAKLTSKSDHSLAAGQTGM